MGKKRPLFVTKVWAEFLYAIKVAKKHEKSKQVFKYFGVDKKYF